MSENKEYIEEQHPPDFYHMFSCQLAEIMENHLGRERQERMVSNEEERVMEIVSQFLRTHEFHTDIDGEADVVHDLMERYIPLVDTIIISRAEFN